MDNLTNEANPTPTTPDLTPTPEAPVQNVAPTTPTTPDAPPITDAAGDLVLPEGTPEFFKDFGKANKLSQDQLNATVEFLSTGLKAQREVELKALADAGQAHIKNWGEQAGQHMSVAKRALKQSDPDGQVTKFLKDTGYANHPVVLEFFKNLGLSMQEGGFLKGAVNVPPGERSLAQTMYGENHPSKE